MKCYHTEGEHHNCVYVEAVNRLIPAAERAAYQRLRDHVADWGPFASTRRKNAKWSQLFIEEMQIACEVAGLRKAGPRCC